MTRIVNKGAWLVITAAIFFHLNGYAAVNDAAIKVKWGYKGNTSPAYWGRLSPSFSLCATGKSQSPINIAKHVAKTTDTLTVNYQPAALNIENNGTTALTIANNQLMINDGHSIQVNFPAKDIKETLTLAGKPYRLVQFHLHSPSENQWHGRSFPMEIHFVHQSSDGQLVVMGVFVNAGKQNTTFQQLMDHLPQSQGTSFLISGVSVNPANLLPTQRDYYEFDGSLTTPPCTEGVHWIVMAEPITASPAQINSLRNAAGGANARPVQPLHHRTISYFKNV